METFLEQTVMQVAVEIILVVLGLYMAYNTYKSRKAQELAETNAKLRSELHKQEHADYKKACERNDKRTKHLIRCMNPIFGGLQELGVNGEFKKEMKNLQSQMIDD